MVRPIAVAFSVMLMLRLMPAASGADNAPELPRIASKSGCVTCHAKTGSGGVVFQAYIQWASSPHAAKSIACEACHGGDASTEDKDKAHAGHAAGLEPGEPINPKNVPAMCGQCHETRIPALHRKQTLPPIGGQRPRRRLRDLPWRQGRHILNRRNGRADVRDVPQPGRGRSDPTVPDQAFPYALLRLTEAAGNWTWPRPPSWRPRSRRRTAPCWSAERAVPGESLDEAITEWHTFNLPSSKGHHGCDDFALQTSSRPSRASWRRCCFRGKASSGRSCTLALFAGGPVVELLILLEGEPKAAANARDREAASAGGGGICIVTGCRL